MLISKHVNPMEKFDFDSEGCFVNYRIIWKASIETLFSFPVVLTKFNFNFLVCNQWQTKSPRKRRHFQVILNKTSLRSNNSRVIILQRFFVCDLPKYTLISRVTCLSMNVNTLNFILINNNIWIKSLGKCDSI